MIDWRYLTTIPEFIGQCGARFGGDLYLGGAWGTSDGICSRSQYAPLVRIGAFGGLQAPWAWPLAAPGMLGYGMGVSALCEWRGNLWASGLQGETEATGEGRLARFDGEAFTTEDTHHAFELVGGADHLFMSWAGALAAWDGLSASIVGQVGGGYPTSLVAWEGRIACFGRDPRTSTNYTLVYGHEADQWTLAQCKHSQPIANTLSGGWFAGTINMVPWRGMLHACEWEHDAVTGEDAFYLSRLAVGAANEGWQRLLRVDRPQPFTVATARGKLVMYESTEDLVTDSSTWNPFTGQWWQASFDGRTVEGFSDCEVVPYRVIGLPDGSAVALCRSRARLEYVRDLLLAGAYVSPATGPDYGTLVYVTGPTQPGPPIIPHGDLAGTVTNDTPAALQGAEVATGDLYDFTDVAGDYGIGDLIIGRHQVAAAKDGYLPEAAEATITDGDETTQDFELADLTAGKCALWGFVRDGVTGGGLYGATVTADDGTTETPATSGAGGFWLLELDPADYTVLASCPGYEDSGEQTATLAAGDVARMDFALFADDGGSVSGFVRDVTDGSAVPAAVVTLTAGGVDYLAITDAAGYYSRAGLPAGQYAASVSATGFLTVTGALSVISGHTTRADWSLAPTGTPVGAVRVTVTDADTGAAISGAVVTLPRIGQAVTDNTGAATVGGLPTGSYRVLVEAQGYFPAGDLAVITAPATTELPVTLDAVPADTQTAWLFGFVVAAADASPIATATVTVAGDAHPDNAVDTTTGASGFYLLTDLVAGAETVTAVKAGYMDGEAANVPLSAGAGTRLDFALLVTGSVFGRVMGYCLDATDSGAVFGAQVWLDGLACVYSGEDGHYDFSTVTAAAHELEAFAAAFYPAHVGGVEVVDGATVEVDLALFRVGRLGTLVVTVEDADGAVVEGATVRVGSLVWGETGGDGTATFVVPEGVLEVLAAKDGYVPGHGMVQVAAAGDAAVTVAITAQDPGDTEGVLAGYVFDQYTRRGLSGATVTAADGVPETGSSSAGGTYSLALPADTYDVTGSADDYSDRTVVDVAIASREVTWLDLPLCPGNDVAGAYFVGVPEAAAVPDGGAGEVLVEWPNADAEWEIAVAVNEESSTEGRLFRRGQRVPRAVRTALAKQGAEVQIVLRRTSGDIGGVGVQLWPK